jgi:hypothetical protein
VFIVPYDAMGSDGGGMLNAAFMRDAMERSKAAPREKFDEAMQRLDQAQQAANAAEGQSARERVKKENGTKR